MYSVKLNKKYGDMIDQTKKSLTKVVDKFDDIGVRTRAIERSLRGVQEMPPLEAAMLPAGALPAPEVDEESAEP